MVRFLVKVHPNHLGTFLALLEEGFGKIRSVRETEYWVLVQVHDDMAIDAFIEHCVAIHLVLDVKHYEGEQ